VLREYNKFYFFIWQQFRIEYIVEIQHKYPSKENYIWSKQILVSKNILVNFATSSLNKLHAD